MKTLIVAFGLVLTAAGVAVAGECPALHTQVMAHTGNRLDAAAYSARALAREGEQLHKDGKHAESVKKYEDAAKAAAINLNRKK